jgi:SAM-dependent methyltransferase
VTPPPAPARLDGALQQARAYVDRAASIAVTMARYAAMREERGLRNGLRAAAALGREIGSKLQGKPGARSCPICGWSGPRFGPVYYVDNYREDIRCYRCGSSDRDRLVKLYVERDLAGFFRERRRRVLDIGPLSYSRSFFPEDADYVSFDLFSPRAMVRGDLCAAPFPDGSFDLWLCFHVLDLIPDDTQAMRELFRVLRPGGVGLLDNVMHWDRETEEYGGPRAHECGHIRRYGTDLPDRLRGLGFEVEIASTEDLFDVETRAAHGIHGRRFLLCRKPG